MLGALSFLRSPLGQFGKNLKCECELLHTETWVGRRGYGRGMPMSLTRVSLFGGPQGSLSARSLFIARGGFVKWSKICSLHRTRRY